MLDQKKTGTFITEMRKEKGLTQKQLAEEIGVSDKAISRWETGRGMPDTAIMPELCRVLGINVNELLSGERLSKEDYSGKAENNMVELIRDKENARKAGKNAAIGTLVGLIALFVFILIIINFSNVKGAIIWFLDAPSLFGVLIMQLIILAASGQFADFFRSFKLVFASKKYKKEELAEYVEKSEYAIKFGIKVTLLSGLANSIIGFVFLMGHLSDPSTIGSNLAVMVLTFFYASIIALVLSVIQGRLRKLV